MKLEHIKLLSKWKKSWIKIGSRAIPHRLKPYEREKYDVALKKWFLEIEEKQRDNLINIWTKTCEVKWIDNILLIKDLPLAIVEKNWNTEFKWTLNEAREFIKSLNIDKI